MVAATFAGAVWTAIKVHPEMSAAEANRAQNNIGDRRMARMAMAFGGVVVVD